MSSVHEYPAVANWIGGREGAGDVTSVRSGTKVSLSVPPEYQGPGVGTNPEELLTSAVAGCYTMTLGIIAANRKLPVASIETRATGEVEQGAGQFTYRSVKLAATIRLPGDASDEQVELAKDLAHKADAYCIVTNALRVKVEITVQPEVVRG